MRHSRYLDGGHTLKSFILKNHSVYPRQTNSVSASYEFKYFNMIESAVQITRLIAKSEQMSVEISVVSQIFR